MTDIRYYVSELVAFHEPSDKREKKSLEEFRRIFPTLMPCNNADNPEHVTASAIIVGKRGVILHKHKLLNKWIQPGGHIEENEFPYDAAIREAMEETGVYVEHPHSTPTFLNLDVHDAPRDHKHLDLRYLVVGDDKDPHPFEGESPECSWVPFRDAIELTDEAAKQAILLAEQWWLEHQDHH